MRILDYFPRMVKKTGDVGVEIEMEGAGFGHMDIVPDWNVHREGSLRGEAIEFVMANPVRLPFVGKHLKRLAKELEKADVKIRQSERAGVHVHVNCQELTIEEVIKFAVLYLTVEDLIVRWCGNEREGNLFCLRARDAEWLLDQLILAQEVANFGLLLDEQNRYSALNMSSLGKFGSIEFRSMSTPENLARIETFCHMLMCIKNASLQYNNMTVMIEAASQRGARDYVRSIFGQYADELMGDDVEDLIMEGLRRVQDIAYIPFKDGRINDEPEQEEEAAKEPQPPPPGIRWEPFNEIHPGPDPDLVNVLANRRPGMINVLGDLAAPAPKPRRRLR